ncbi:tyrosine-type recombinase/integrase [Mangrovibacillus cuniculi]|uniref:Site-specific integrase n=1 Tax=Mangrovibacillus cuniculi TaxID=2593652 RepID=A0A7S8HGS9_9BACI|nr:site-specific integrase [Mangrovibacillus cuniculi]QPC48218.1 site-specific integrase [Mangrovibacillus cuniculi]
MMKKAIIEFGNKGKYAVVFHDCSEKEAMELFTQRNNQADVDDKLKDNENCFVSMDGSTVKKGFLPKNSVSSTHAKNSSSGDKVILSYLEIEKLLEVAHIDREGIMYELALATGLRLGELLALSWSDVDFEHHTIIVKNSVAEAGGKQSIIRMRSKIRKIVIPAQVLAKLLEYQKEQQFMKDELGEQNDDEINLVFPQINGGLQMRSVVEARFKRLVEKAGIRRVTFHVLRRTHVALIIKAGVPFNLVCNQLGYENGDTLFRILP